MKYLICRGPRLTGSIDDATCSYSRDTERALTLQRPSTRMERHLDPFSKTRARLAGLPLPAPTQSRDQRARKSPGRPPRVHSKCRDTGAVRSERGVARYRASIRATARSPDRCPALRPRSQRPGGGPCRSLDFSSSSKHTRASMARPTDPGFLRL